MIFPYLISLSISSRVEKALKRHPLELPRIAIIEFARNDYIQALSQFAPDFLKDAHLLESDVDTCMDRIERRIRCCESADDTFVPVNFMEDYYQTDSTPDRVRELQVAFGLNDHQIQLMNVRKMNFCTIVLKYTFSHSLSLPSRLDALLGLQVSLTLLISLFCETTAFTSRKFKEESKLTSNLLLLSRKNLLECN